MRMTVPGNGAEASVPGLAQIIYVVHACESYVGTAARCGADALASSCCGEPVS